MGFLFSVWGHFCAKRLTQKRLWQVQLGWDIHSDWQVVQGHGDLRTAPHSGVLGPEGSRLGSIEKS